MTLSDQDPIGTERALRVLMRFARAARVPMKTTPGWLALACLLVVLTPLRAPRADVPRAPARIEVYAGDGAAALGWTPVPGAVYELTLDPPVPFAEIRIAGSRAVVRGLVNGTTYLVAVRARNASGLGPPRFTRMTPSAVNPLTAVPILVSGEPRGRSGSYDPSVVRTSASELWMAYSAVDYYAFAGLLIQDVATQLARSTDGGRTFQYVRTIAAPDSASVTDVGGQACGSGQRCDGRFVYETPWLVHDPEDPIPGRRWKLFAHQYFLYPPRQGAATVYTLGAIVMWTAERPDGVWSRPEAVLGWNLTPPELSARTNVNRLHPELSRCLVVTEGGATVRRGVIDVALACVEGPDTSLTPQKIVLLRSHDHARSFEYVSTPLRSEHARLLGASHFSAPSLLPSDGLVSLLAATPVVSGAYSGCAIIPIADDVHGEPFRDAAGIPIGILGAGLLPGHQGGACALDHGNPTLFADDLDPASPRPFRIIALPR